MLALIVRGCNVALGSVNLAVGLGALFPEIGVLRMLYIQALYMLGSGGLVVPLSGTLWMLLGLVRLHAGIWTAEKSTFRLACWTYIAELTFFLSIVVRRTRSFDQCMSSIAVCSLMLLLHIITYRSFMKAADIKYKYA